MVEISREIIEQERLEDELRLQNEIISNMAEGLYLIRLEDVIIVYANPKLEKMFGYNPGEMIGRHASIVNAPTAKSPEETANEILAVLHETGEWHGEVNNIKRDGTPFWCYANVSIFDHSKHGKVLVAVHTDITERKQAEELLAKQQYYLEKAQELGQIGTWELDILNNILVWTDENCRMFGVPSGSIVNYEVFIAKVHPEDREYVDREWSAAMQGKPYDIEHRLIDAGETKWVREKADLTFDEEGNAVSAIGFTQDITERKQAEEALRESELKFRLLADYTYDWEYWINPDGDYIYLSPSCEQITSYKPEDFICNPKLLFDIVKPSFADKVHHHYEAENDKETPFCSMEFPIITKNGEERWLEHNCNPVFDEEGNYVGRRGNNRDITERKQAEEVRTKLNSQLEIKVKELEEVVYVASHDLRTPLVTIEGFGGVLEESLQEISTALEKEELSPQTRAWLAPFFKDSHEAIKYISTSATNMASLLHGLLQVSRLAKIEVNKENLDMNSLMSEVLAGFKYQSEEQGVKISVSTLPSCEGDKMQLSQVFGNLIGNAFKYADPDRPGVIKVSGRKEGEQSVYCVEDNGLGIAPEYQKKIFDIFHQLNRASDGEGLGLSIVRKIVERHNGRIWVESEVGKGSRFYVSL